MGEGRRRGTGEGTETAEVGSFPISYNRRMTVRNRGGGVGAIARKILLSTAIYAAIQRSSLITSEPGLMNRIN